MNDQQPAPSMPPTAPAPAPSQSMQMPGFLASLGPAELLMAAGAALIVAIDLVFVIFGPYGFSPIAWGAAALTLILIFLNSRMMGFSAATTRGLLLTLGALAAFTWVRDVLDDVRFLGNANVAPTYYLGLLGYYVGVALLVFGAWQVWKHKA